ncbi:MAG TPA: cupin domain-containing protein [Gemmatimonadaceae bacterium]|nr:cupin domain-containing protein [Gemmatimonadaceae bacterium]
MFRPAFLASICAALVLPVASAAAQQQATSAAVDSMVPRTATSLQWAPLELPGFAPGLTMAVLQGDPSQPGMYTVRLKFPAGYAFPAHWHPNAENLTVVSGTFLVAMGERTEPSRLRTYHAGDFLYFPAHHVHFGRVEGPTVIQLHGMGPFQVTVVEQLSSASQ